MQNMKTLFRSISTVLLTALFFTGCGSYYQLLKVNEDKSKGSTMLVLYGEKVKGSSEIVEIAKQSFREKSRFKVKAVAVENIRPPYTKTLTKENVDFNNVDKDKVIELGEKAGVDYVFVFWMGPEVLVIDNAQNRVTYYCQIYGVKDKIELGRSGFYVIWSNKDATLIDPDERTTSFTTMCKDGFDGMAAEIADKMNKKPTNAVSPGSADDSAEM
jgi:hypothetical protein